MTEQLIFGLAVLGIPFLVLVLSPLFSRGREMTAPATVLSHRVEPANVASQWSNNWSYLVLFRLSDGSELELYTTEGEYHQLNDGESGLLTWEKENLCHFDPDMPQERSDPK